MKMKKIPYLEDTATGRIRVPKDIETALGQPIRTRTDLTKALVRLWLDVSLARMIDRATARRSDRGDSEGV
jgi:hypothetical protein